MHLAILTNELAASRDVRNAARETLLALVNDSDMLFEVASLGEGFVASRLFACKYGLICGCGVDQVDVTRQFALSRECILAVITFWRMNLSDMIL